MLRPNGRSFSLQEANVAVWGASRCRVTLLVGVLLAGTCPGVSAARRSHTPSKRTTVGFTAESLDGLVRRQHLERAERLLGDALNEFGSTGADQGNPDGGQDKKDASSGSEEAIDITQQIRKKAKEGHHVAKVIVKKMAEKVKKPLMNKINCMRARLCWMRPDLWNHKECLKFLGLQCAKMSTGDGLCKRFKNGVQEHCKDAEGGSRAQKAYCRLAKRMRIIPNDDDKKDEEKKKEPEKEKPQDDEEASEKKDEQAPGGKEPRNSTNITNVTIIKVNSDIDGDGIPNEKDLFPKDAKEWADMDKDGIGDNSDPDIDGDGVPNEQDSFPMDGSRFSEDRDKDGIADKDDLFPDDPNEWADIDKDGIGDKADDDRDGDGVPDVYDMYPDDPTLAVSDRDGDGVPDDEDAFPDDPDECKDSDGDGVGDGKDPFPKNPHCWKDPCANPTGSPYNKIEKPLPSQGYEEHSPRKVEHDDQRTWTGDWREEWPTSKETETESIRRICQEQPDNEWCRKYRKNLRSGR